MDKHRILETIHEIHCNSIFNWIPNEHLKVCIKVSIGVFVEKHMINEARINASVACFEKIQLDKIQLDDRTANTPILNSSKYYENCVQSHLKNLIDNTETNNNEVIGAFYSYLLILTRIFDVEVSDPISVEIAKHMQGLSLKETTLFDGR
jgi:hypothetical protein